MVKLTIIFMLIYSVSRYVTGDKTVTTTTGDIQGVTLPHVEAFLGVPFAESPVGPLRFRKPIPKSPWSGTYVASFKGSPCVQASPSEVFPIGDVPFFPDKNKISEDCLFLNVWVPNFDESSELKPILVWIYGGALILGSSDLGVYDGKNLADRGNIIVMNFNYRVGMLGLFSSFTEDAPGNMPLHDSILAIQWMKDNAKAFGGDPERITVAGHSAGSIVIAALLVSPVTKNLFSRVILESTSVFNPNMYDEGNVFLHSVRNRLTVSLGCSNTTLNMDSHPELVMQCLRNVPVDEVVKAEMKMMGTVFLPYRLRVGDELLPSLPIDVYRSGGFHDVDTIVGATKDEGTIFVSAALGDYMGYYGENRHGKLSTSLLRGVLRLIPRVTNATMPKEALDYYTEQDWDPIEALSKLIGDFGVICPAIFHADFASMRNPVYFYRFSHHSSFSPYAEWTGAIHSEELMYIFGTPHYWGISNFTFEEAKLSERIMDRWATFAKTGNPNIPGEPEWPQYSFENPQYLNIDLQDKADTAPFDHRCDIWREKFNSAINEDLVNTIGSKI